MRAGRACGYDIVVLIRLHSLDIELRSLLRVLTVAHVGCRRAAAGLAHRHIDHIADRVEVGNDRLGDVDISEVSRHPVKIAILPLGLSTFCWMVGKISRKGTGAMLIRLLPSVMPDRNIGR